MWSGSGIARCRGAVRTAACAGTACGGLLTAGCPLLASIIRIPCAASALSPEARAGCGKPARPDPWRGLWATMIPTPTSFQLSVAHLYHAIEKSTVILTDHRECGRHEDRVGNRLPRRGGSNSPSSSSDGSRISTERGTLSGGQSPLEHRRIHFHRSHVLR